MDLIFLQHNSSSLYSPNFIRQPKHFFLTTSIPLQNRQNRLKQNLNIQSDIPLGHIFCIQADDFFKVCDVASADDLPHSGDSGLDGDSGTVVQLIMFQFVGEDGAGSHKAHGASLCQVRNNFGHKKRASDYSETLFISPFPQTKHIFFLFFIPHTTLYPLSSKLFFHFLKSFFKWDKILIYYRFKTHFFL